MFSRVFKQVCFVLLLGLILGTAWSCGPKPNELEVLKGIVPGFMLPEGEARELKVVFASPEGEVSDSADCQKISVIFNQPMVALSADGATVPIPKVILTPEVSGRWDWKGTATLVFTPDTKLELATHYTVRLPDELKSYAGRSLRHPYEFSFTTPRVKLDYSVPCDFADLVVPQQAIYLAFSQPVFPATVQQYLSFTKKNSSLQVPAKVRAVTDSEWRKVQEEAQYSDSSSQPQKAQVVAVVPEEPLSIATRYQLTVKKGLRGVSHSEIGSLKDQSISFSTYNKFKLEKLVSSSVNAEGKEKFQDQNTLFDPGDSVCLFFSNPVYPKELAKYISIQPPVGNLEQQLELEGRLENYVLDLHLLPRTNYSVSFKPGFTDVFGNDLSGETVFSYKTGDYKPKLSMTEGMGVLESSMGTSVPCSVMNLDSVKVEMTRWTKDLIVPLAKKDHTWSTNLDNSLPIVYDTYRQDWHPKSTLNVTTHNRLSLQPALGSAKTGFVHLICTTPTGEEYKAFYQLTDIGLSVKCARQNTLVWVTSLSTGRPLPNAQVELRNENNEVVWQGLSDSSGLAFGPGRLRSVDEYYVFASLGEDCAFLDANSIDSFGAWDFQLNGSSFFDNEYRTEFFGDRDLYQPGEQVNLKAFLRQPSLKAWRLPQKDRKVKLNIVYGDSELNEKRMLSVSAQGTVDASFTIPKNAKPGGAYCTLELESEGKSEPTYTNLGQFSFTIAEFESAKFEVNIKTNTKSLCLGDSLKASLQGRYLFGGNMSKDKYSYNAYIQPTSFTSDSYPDYVFGTDCFYRNSASTEDEDSYQGLLTKGEGLLDEQGCARLALEVKNKRVLQPSILSLEGKVRSASRQELSKRVGVKLLPASYIAGTKMEDAFVQAGSPIGLELVACDALGKAVKGVPLQLTLKRRQWLSVRSAGLGQGYSWSTQVKDETVKTMKLVSLAQSQRVTLEPAKAGFYVIEVVAVDKKGRQCVSSNDFYVSGNDYVAWERSDSDVIKLVPDRSEYNKGDVAKIFVQSPYERATALVTVERDSVENSYVTELVGTASTVSVPIVGEYMPNVVVSVLLLHPRIKDRGYAADGLDLGKPSFKIGAVSLNVNAASKELKVNVKPSKTVYEPGDEVQLDLTLRDYLNQPVSGEVCLAVVDEGILSLTDYKTPDLFNSFYRIIGLSVVNADSRSGVVGQRAQSTKGDDSGGGGGQESDSTNEYGERPRSDFRYTAFWSPSLMVGEDGQAHVRFKLPDNMTRFRIMAMAATKDSCFGTGVSSLEVNKPLLLLPAMPSFVRVGDQFQAGVVVYNNTDESLNVKVNTQTTGLSVVNNNVEAQVKAGSSQAVVFDYRAPKVGSFKISFKALAGGKSDSLQLTVPVQKEEAREVVSDSGRVSAGKQERVISIDSKALPGTVSLDASLANSQINVGLQSAFRNLFDECFDNSATYAARLVVLTQGRSLFLANSSSDISSKQLNLMAEKYVKNLKSYIQDDGGVAIYQDVGYSSIEATNAVLRALKQVPSTISVPDSLLSDCKGFLRAQLYQGEYQLSYLLKNSSNYDIDQKAYTAAALAFCGDLSEADALAIYNQRDKLSLEGQLCLLDILQCLKMELAGEYRSNLLNKLKVEARVAWLEDGTTEHDSFDYFFNLAGCNAYALQLFLDGGDFELAPKMVRWLLDARINGHWGGPLVDGQVLQALVKYGEKYEKDSLSTEQSGLVSVDGKGLINAKLSLKNPVAVSSMELNGKGPFKVNLENKGSSELYYDLIMHYAPSEGVRAKDRGLMVFQTITDIASGRVQDGPFKTGEVYQATVSVVAPVNRRQVTVDCPIPAGCEIVQTSFATESQEYSYLLGEAAKKNSEKRTGFYQSFDGSSVHSDRVTIYADELTAGEHLFTYLLRARQAGHFRTPGIRAYELNRPEVFGTTQSYILKILPGK